MILANTIGFCVLTLHFVTLPSNLSVFMMACRFIKLVYINDDVTCRDRSVFPFQCFPFWLLNCNDRDKLKDMMLVLFLTSRGKSWVISLCLMLAAKFHVYPWWRWRSSFLFLTFPRGSFFFFKKSHRVLHFAICFFKKHFIII